MTESRHHHGPPKSPFFGFYDVVRQCGRRVESRFGPTIEMTAMKTSFTTGSMIARSRINYSIGWMEMLQLIGGVYDPDAIARVAPKANLELFTAKMAYGPRVVDQIEPLIAHLDEKPDSRQAVLFIAKPEDGLTNNQPCTTTMQFFVRDGVLSAVVSMRSWDLVKGMAYDVMMFGGLTLALARCLSLDAGRVTVNAGSAHIYVAEQKLAPFEVEPLFTFSPIVPRQWPRLRQWAVDETQKLQSGETPTGVVIDWKGAR